MQSLRSRVSSPFIPKLIKTLASILIESYQLFNTLLHHQTTDATRIIVNHGRTRVYRAMFSCQQVSYLLKTQTNRKLAYLKLSGYSC